MEEILIGASQKLCPASIANGAGCGIFSEVRPGSIDVPQRGRWAAMEVPWAPCVVDDAQGLSYLLSNRCRTATCIQCCVSGRWPSSETGLHPARNQSSG